MTEVEKLEAAIILLDKLATLVYELEVQFTDSAYGDLMQYIDTEVFEFLEENMNER